MVIFHKKLKNKCIEILFKKNGCEQKWKIIQAMLEFRPTFPGVDTPRNSGWISGANLHLYFIHYPMVVPFRDLIAYSLV